MNFKFLPLSLCLQTTPKKLTLALAFAGLCGLATPLIASDAVIAVVNGDKITESQLKLAATQSQIDYAAITPEQKKAFTDALVNRQLVLQEAIKAKYDKDADIIAQVKALTDSYIAANYLTTIAKAFKVDEKEVKAYYDEKVIPNMPKEYKARHILVKEESEAKTLIIEIEGGADFSTLAKEKSIDTGSGANGGDLGWFTGQNMVPSFIEAVSVMKKGEVSKTAVKSQFGWHIIILDDERAATPPKFDEVKQDIEKVIIKEKLNQYLNDLNSSAKITITP